MKRKILVALAAVGLLGVGFAVGQSGIPPFWNHETIQTLTLIPVSGDPGAYFVRSWCATVTADRMVILGRYLYEAPYFEYVGGPAIVPGGCKAQPVPLKYVPQAVEAR